jgi:KUP system potassium uptake protein
MLVNELKEFIQKDDEESDGKEVVVARIINEEMVQREVGTVDDALTSGDIVYLMGENEVMASKGSSLLKIFAVN